VCFDGVRLLILGGVGRGVCGFLGGLFVGFFWLGWRVACLIDNLKYVHPVRGEYTYNEKK